MNQIASSSSGKTTVIRYIARTIATLFVLVFLFFFVADCVGKGTIPIENDRILMSIFLLVTFIGLIIAWKWEGTGGILSLLGLIGFYVFAPWSVTNAVNFLFTFIYGLPALLFLYCWWQDRRQSNPNAS